MLTIRILIYTSISRRLACLVRQQIFKQSTVTDEKEHMALLYERLRFILRLLAVKVEGGIPRTERR